MSDPFNFQDDKEIKTTPLTLEDEPKSQWRRWNIPVLMVLIVATFIILRNHNAPAPFQHNEGAVFGTLYHITYQYPEDLQDQIEEQMQSIDESLSMFNPQSTLSRINQGEDIEADSLLKAVFKLSQQVSEATDGAFDITVAPLVNAWGFGFKEGTLPDSAQIDSLRQLVGWQQVTMDDAGHIHRKHPNTILDCSAIAKGLGVDVVANFLRACGIINYMVEIGGEVVVGGVNPKGTKWHIGVNSPEDDPESQKQELSTVLELTDRAMATSGNYRNFYVTDDGQRIAHTIDPSTGYPAKQNILSATVLAPTCACADAFATAFMVMGLERAKDVLSRHPELQVYLIYDSLGTYQTYSTIDF